MTLAFEWVVIHASIHSQFRSEENTYRITYYNNSFLTYVIFVVTVCFSHYLLLKGNHIYSHEFWMERFWICLQSHWPQCPLSLSYAVSIEFTSLNCRNENSLQHYAVSKCHRQADMSQEILMGALKNTNNKNFFLLCVSPVAVESLKQKAHALVPVKYFVVNESNPCCLSGFPWSCTLSCTRRIMGLLTMQHVTKMVSLYLLSSMRWDQQWTMQHNFVLVHPRQCWCIHNNQARKHASKQTNKQN
jgi:hypothetical protein